MTHAQKTANCLRWCMCFYWCSTYIFVAGDCNILDDAYTLVLTTLTLHCVCSCISIFVKSFVAVRVTF